MAFNIKIELELDKSTCSSIKECLEHLFKGMLCL